MTQDINQFPIYDPLIRHDSDYMSQQWFVAMASFYQTLIEYLTANGIFFPPVDAATIAAIEAPYTAIIGNPLGNLPDISGQTAFDSTNRVPKQFVITFAGPNVLTATWKTFTLV